MPDRDPIPCALCQQPKPIRLSHIIPRTILKPLADQNGKTIAINLQKVGAPTFNLRMSERLLCSDCEGRISKNESYLADFLGRANRPIERIAKDTIRISGIDYQKFKLFYLSILWRAHISKLEFFRVVDVGETHSAALAKMLLADDPGAESDYPLFLMKLFDPAGRGTEKGVVTQPTATRFGGARAYRSIFGGFDWNIAVTRRPEHGFENYALLKSGTINCIYIDFMQHDVLKDSAQRYAKGRSFSV